MYSKYLHLLAWKTKEYSCNLSGLAGLEDQNIQLSPQWLKGKCNYGIFYHEQVPYLHPAVTQLDSWKTEVLNCYQASILPTVIPRLPHQAERRKNPASNQLSWLALISKNRPAVT
jgi:hypothetical protein